MSIPHELTPELEARLVALVHSEVTDSERAELEALIDQHANVREFYEAMQRVHGLLQVEVVVDLKREDEEAEDASDDWSLAADRRKELFSVLSGVKEPSARDFDGTPIVTTLPQYDRLYGPPPGFSEHCELRRQKERKRAMFARRLLAGLAIAGSAAGAMMLWPVSSLQSSNEHLVAAGDDQVLAPPPYVSNAMSSSAFERPADVLRELSLNQKSAASALSDLNSNFAAIDLSEPASGSPGGSVSAPAIKVPTPYYLYDDVQDAPTDKLQLGKTTKTDATILGIVVPEVPEQMLALSDDLPRSSVSASDGGEILLGGIRRRFSGTEHFNSEFLDDRFASRLTPRIIIAEEEEAAEGAAGLGATGGTAIEGAESEVGESIVSGPLSGITANAQNANGRGEQPDALGGLYGGFSVEQFSELSRPSIAANAQALNAPSAETSHFFDASGLEIFRFDATQSEGVAGKQAGAAFGAGGFGGMGGGLGGEGFSADAQSDGSELAARGAESNGPVPSTSTRQAGQAGSEQRVQRDFGTAPQSSVLNGSGNEASEGWQYGFAMPDQSGAQPGISQPGTPPRGDNQSGDVGLAAPQDVTRFGITLDGTQPPAQTQNFRQQSAPYYPYSGTQGIAPNDSKPESADSSSGGTNPPAQAWAANQFNYSDGDWESLPTVPSDTPAEIALDNRQGMSEATKRKLAEDQSSTWADIAPTRSGYTNTDSIDPAAGFLLENNWSNRTARDSDADLELPEFELKQLQSLEKDFAELSKAAGDSNGELLKGYKQQLNAIKDQLVQAGESEREPSEVAEFDDSVTFKVDGNTSSDEFRRREFAHDYRVSERQEVERQSRRLADAEKQLQESLSIVGKELAEKSIGENLGQQAVDYSRPTENDLASRRQKRRELNARLQSETALESGFVDALNDVDRTAIPYTAGEPLGRADALYGYAPSAVERRGEKQRQLAERAEPSQALGEVSAEQEAFSTFSLHVSDVAFKLAQSALEKGQWPEASKVRIEEFVNALDYGDPLPSSGEAVAARVEQCVHPFLQQRNMMRVAMRTSATGRAAQTPLRLTLLVDNSGSMERIDRRQTVVKAFRLLTQQLQSGDQVTLIGFARTPNLLAERVPAEKAVELANRVATMPSQGGTNIEAALELAFAKAKEQFDASGQNRIILFTDGAVNLGDAEPESLSKIVAQMRESKIAFDAAGISADGLNDEVLEALARKGDGRYYLLDSAESADAGFARQVAGALRPSAKNVKVQVEFNPERVGQYKLLGFEKHQLKKEDFGNDAVDAAELAAEEAGVAVYQFEAKPDGNGDIGFVSVRFQDVASGEMVERRWPIPYEPQPARIEDTTDTMRLAATSALFAAKLRGDALGEAVQWKRMFQVASTLSGSQRVADLKQMIQKAADLAQ